MKILMKHLNQVGETYWEHLSFGMWAAAICLLLSITSFIHAIFPFILPRRPEKIYQYLHCKAQVRLNKITSRLEKESL
jgi:hypothetical protein